MSARDVMTNYRSLVQHAQETLQAQQKGMNIRIQVGSATCEDAAGSLAVAKAFRKLIDASKRTDIALVNTGCTGRCSREPIVTVILPGELPVKYQHVNEEVAEEIFRSHVLKGRQVKGAILNYEEAGAKYQLLFCGGEQCGLNVAGEFRQMFEQALCREGIGPEQAKVIRANCFGLCVPADVGKVTHVLVRPSNVVYRIESQADIDEIIARHIRLGQVVERLLARRQPIDQGFFELYGDVGYFHRQSRVALRNCGVIDPESLDDYLVHNGFRALAMVLERNDPGWVIQEITASRLRGRGGAGYSTGRKWSDAIASPSDGRYIICNADEGDPGAFMDRDTLESDPCSVIEGMLIGAFAIGADQGLFYVRSEYPMAVRRIERALAACRKRGLLGKNILGSDFSCDLEVRLGAGAFVCGEETAMIASIEGRRGWPRVRPPYPTTSGLWGKSTVINNVETFANVPAVINYGADWFAQIGTARSGGTKVFALSGKIQHTGLVEVPMGTTLREIVFDIGGGVPDGKALKAVQTGGPAGGCIPASWIDTVVDFDTLTAAGSIMGSGGMIVMDESECMVDIAKFFMTFSQDESCGECTPCREGTKRMLEILDRITAGQGVEDDLVNLERLGKLLRKASLCGLGRAAPNPVLSTLRHFRDEYEAHVREKRCPAGKCKFEKKDQPVMPYRPGMQEPLTQRIVEVMR